MFLLCISVKQIKKKGSHASIETKQCLARALRHPNQYVHKWQANSNFAPFSFTAAVPRFAYRFSIFLRFSFLKRPVMTRTHHKSTWARARGGWVRNRAINLTSFSSFFFVCYSIVNLYTFKLFAKSYGLNLMKKRNDKRNHKYIPVYMRVRYNGIYIYINYMHKWDVRVCRQFYVFFWYGVIHLRADDSELDKFSNFPSSTNEFIDF